MFFLKIMGDIVILKVHIFCLLISAYQDCLAAVKRARSGKMTTYIIFLSLDNK